MLNKIALLWIVFASLLSFAAGGSFVSAFLVPPISEQRNAQRQYPSASTQSPEERHQATEQALAEYTKWLMLFTGVMAIATIGLGGATGLLYVAGERHSERELRAYIAGPTSANVRNFHSSTNPTVLLSFKNSGQTPAHNVCVWTSSAVATYPMENPPERPKGGAGEGSSLGTVGPQGDFHNEIQSDIAVTAAERAAVVAGHAAFFVYGEISYQDAFGKEREATFCHFYAGGRARGNDGPLATYHKWNRAT